MKPEMRHKLAQLPFEEKIRKVGQLIQLSRKMKAQRIRESAEKTAKSAKFPRKF
jgi:hypothetical protein